MVRLCRAFGFDTVIIETVGAGQGDTAVRDLTDMVVLLVQPHAQRHVKRDPAGRQRLHRAHVQVVVVLVGDQDRIGRDEIECVGRAMLNVTKRGFPNPVLENRDIYVMCAKDSK